MEQLEIWVRGGLPMTLYIILFFILGTILGSFYHVVGYRLPKKESIIKPKYSYCPYCGKRLKWYELIPILSYLMQLGKCRNCHKKVSIFYPFIEMVTGLLFAVSFYSFGFSYEFLTALILVSLFSIVIVSDLTYMIIPDEVTFISAIMIIVINFLHFGWKGGFYQLGSGIFTFIVMYLILLAGNFVFKKETLGGADVKLMLISGLVLHPLLGVFVIFLASSIALPVSIAIYTMTKEHMIPFGPFIIAAILLLFLFKIDIYTFTNLFLR